MKLNLARVAFPNIQRREFRIRWQKPKGTKK